MPLMRWSALCAAMALAMGCSGGSHPWKLDSTPLPFEPTTWRSADADDRGRMCADLLATHKLVGMPLSAVIELLGAPDSSNHSIWYWLGPDPDDLENSGRFKIDFEDELVASFDPDCLPSVERRPAAVPFERERWLAASWKERLAMLDGALALQSEFLGRPRAAVEDYFGAPSERSHDIWYALNTAPEDSVAWSERTLSLDINTDGFVVNAVDYVARD